MTYQRISHKSNHKIKSIKSYLLIHFNSEASILAKDFSLHSCCSLFKRRKMNYFGRTAIRLFQKIGPLLCKAILGKSIIHHSLNFTPIMHTTNKGVSSPRSGLIPDINLVHLTSMERAAPGF